MEANDVKLMFNIIIDICDRTFFLTQQQPQDQPQQLQQPQITGGIFDEKIYQLPSFIESLAYVCNQIDDTLPEGSINVLEKMVVLAIDSYPKLIKRYSHQITLAIAHLFVSIQIGKPHLYGDFIGRIVYQSLLRIFSYRTSYFTSQQGLAEPERTRPDEVFDENIERTNAYHVSCADYIQFWSSLLNLNEFKELSTLGVHVNEKRKLIGVVYDEIVESLVKIMKKLDLTAVKEEVVGGEAGSMADASSNPVIGLKPLRPRDFEVLVNLVDFSR